MAVMKLRSLVACDARQAVSLVELGSYSTVEQDQAGVISSLKLGNEIEFVVLL